MVESKVERCHKVMGMIQAGGIFEMDVSKMSANGTNRYPLSLVKRSKLQGIVHRAGPWADRAESQRHHKF